MFPRDFKQYKFVLEDKDKEITSMKNKLKILDAHLVQIDELVAVEKKSQDLKTKIHTPLC